MIVGYRSYLRVKHKDRFAIIMTEFDSESVAPVCVQKFMCIDRGSAGSKLLSVDTKRKSLKRINTEYSPRK